MRKNFLFTFLIFLIVICYPVFSQNHISVPLDNQIYNVLEQIEMRGLCAPLSGVRPYTRNVVIEKINEILNSKNNEKLNNVEKEILEQYLNNFSKPKKGIDWSRLAWYDETSIGKNDTVISANIGIKTEIEGSLGVYPKKNYFGTEIWIGAYWNGDLGNNVSYDLSFKGGLIKSPRDLLGKYNTYYDGFPNEDETDSEYANRKIKIYSEPLTYFPYTYKKRWDGSVFFLDKLSSYGSWPTEIAGGYGLPSELAASFLENKLLMRLGRISHDWGSTTLGGSLAFNQMARPFIGIEAEFYPVSWFNIASLTGILEYNNEEGIKKSAFNFQNAFSITMLQFKYKNYLFFDFVDAVVYPKRLELGYISPITNSYLYQNNIGDFDNMAVTFNLKAQYPGLGNIWFTFFVDEMNLIADLWTLDRQMVAVQTGTNVSLPFISFSSLKISYTKINPYCYTHNRNYNPWHADLRMETGYYNNGVGLGYYLPPNSDEILVQFKTMPAKSITASLQYQLIRHGADFGGSAVDGSNLLSELDPVDRDNNSVLKRFFLHDGAYQWSHIIKLGFEWSLNEAPITFYGETGANISYFTNTKEPANTGKSYPYSIKDTSEYPKSTAFILRLGVKVQGK